jgi:hypothetical protein
MIIRKFAALAILIVLVPVTTGAARPDGPCDQPGGG